jgi:hypothetical protein
VKPVRRVTAHAIAPMSSAAFDDHVNQCCALARSLQSYLVWATHCLPGKEWRPPWVGRGGAGRGPTLRAKATRKVTRSNTHIHCQHFFGRRQSLAVVLSIYIYMYIYYACRYTYVTIHSYMCIIYIYIHIYKHIHINRDA